MNWASRVSAKTSAISFGSCVKPWFPCIVYFGSFLFVRDLQVLKIFGSLGLSDMRKEFHSFSL